MFYGSLINAFVNINNKQQKLKKRFNFLLCDACVYNEALIKLLVVFCL